MKAEIHLYFISSPFLSPSQESGEYDGHTGEGESSSFRASRALRPAVGGGSNAHGDRFSSGISHRPGARADETDLS